MCNTPQNPEVPDGPRVGAFMRNMMRKDIPLPRRLWLMLRNNGRKAVTLSNCCGHPGEPGC